MFSQTFIDFPLSGLISEVMTCSEKIVDDKNRMLKYEWTQKYVFILCFKSKTRNQFRVHGASQMTYSGALLQNEKITLHYRCDVIFIAMN